MGLNRHERRKRSVSLFLTQHLSELFNSWRAKNNCREQLLPAERSRFKLLLDSGKQPYQSQGVTAEIKEVVLHTLRWHRPGEPAVHHDNVEARIGRQEREARRQIGGVERHIDAASLQDPQSSHDHRRRAVDADAHRDVPADAARPQAMRQTVGAPVQLPVGRARLFVDHVMGLPNV